jgi:hypothetical protein
VRHREARDLASDAARADQSNRRHEQEYAMDVNRSTMTKSEAEPASTPVPATK